jgi:hypothetical protein
MLSIATQGNHILEAISMGTWPGTFDDDIHGVWIKFTTISKKGPMSIPQLERIANAAISAADAEAELIDRRL